MQDEDPRLSALARLQDVVDELRAEGGCPWDREQTQQSLAPHLLEEAFELCDALRLDRDDQKRRTQLLEEHGDLLFNVLLLAKIAEDESRYSIADVAELVRHKLIRRHPHVFGDEKLDEASGAIGNWERIKAEEKKESGQADKSRLSGVPGSMPALLRAQRVGEKCAQVGFEWPELGGAMDKLHEEVQELEAELAPKERDPERLEAELGDLLFATVNVARMLGIQAELSLQACVDRFTERFRHIERSLGPRLEEAGLEEMEALWLEAKDKEG